MRFSPSRLTARCGARSAVGTPRIEDFNDPANVTVQELGLTDDGITELSLTQAARSIETIPPVAGAPVRSVAARRPAVVVPIRRRTRGEPGRKRAKW